MEENIMENAKRSTKKIDLIKRLKILVRSTKGWKNLNNINLWNISWF